MKPGAVIFDLFGDHLRYHGGGARPQGLVALLDVFGIGEPTARIALARMRKEGWFATHREARQVAWTLTEKSWWLLDEGRARIFSHAPGPWDGQWRMVVYAMASSTGAAGSAATQSVVARVRAFGRRHLDQSPRPSRSGRAGAVGDPRGPGRSARLPVPEPDERPRHGRALLGPRGPRLGVRG